MTTNSGYSPGNGFIGFNYNSEADRIKRQRALADALAVQSQKQVQPSFVSNGTGTFYSGADGKLSAISQLAAALLASKNNNDASERQKNVDKTSADALAYHLDPNNAPWAQRQAEEDAYAQAEETIARLKAQGVSEQPTAQQLGPGYEEARPAPLPAPAEQPLPTETPKPSAVVAKALQAPVEKPNLTPQQIEAYSARQASQTQGQRRGSSGSLRRNAYVAGLNQPVSTQPTSEGGATGSWGDPAPVPIASAAATALAPMQAPTQQPAPQPVAAAPAAAMTQPLTPQVQVAQAIEGVQRARVQPTVSEQLKHISAIANTGPIGAQIAQAEFQNMFGAKNEYEVSPIKDKDTGDITAVLKYNRRTGQYQVDNLSEGRSGEKVLETKDTPTGIMERTRSGWRLARDQNGNVVAGKEAQDTKEKQGKLGAELDSHILAGEALKKSLNALTSIDPKTGKPVIDAAAGLGGRLSLLYNKITSDPTKASVAQAEIDGLKSKLFNYGMAKIKAAGGGAGAANSDAEGKRIEANLGNLDIRLLGPEGFIRKANEIIAEIDASAARYDAMAAQQGAPLATRQPGAAPQRMSYDAFKVGR